MPLSTGRSVVFVALLFLGANAPAQTARRDRNIATFLGRKVTVAEGARDPRDPDSDFPKGPASVCLEGPPQRQCYTAPKDYGNDPTVRMVQVQKDMAALLFSAATGGTSGWGIHFALLRPGAGKELEDLFPLDLSISNQGQHEFLSDPSISDAQIFVTADFARGPDEGHYGKHRCMISAYTGRLSLELHEFSYDLDDQYMTVRKYDLDGGADVLASEKQEILARLRRAKAEGESKDRAPR